jgi:hypothetical protein
MIDLVKKFYEVRKLHFEIQKLRSEIKDSRVVQPTREQIERVLNGTYQVSQGRENLSPKPFAVKETRLKQ